MDLAKLLVSDSFAWSCPYYAVPVLWGQFAALSLGVLYCLAYSDASLIFTYFKFSMEFTWKTTVTTAVLNWTASKHHAG